MSRTLRSLARLPAAMMALSGCADEFEFDPSRPSMVIERTYHEADIDEEIAGCHFEYEGICVVRDTVEIVYAERYELVLEQCKSGPRRTDPNEECLRKSFDDISKGDFSLVRERNVVVLDEDHSVTIIPQPVSGLVD